MNRISWWISIILLLLVFLLVPILKIDASTNVESDITSDTTWTIDQSPYILNFPIIVTENATLSIEPGVIIKFDGSASLIVDGSLQALGTESQPIYFTSLSDDTRGGDTNEDGSNTSPGVFDWGYVVIESLSLQSRINHVVSRYSSGLLIFDSSIVSENLDSDQSISAFSSEGSFSHVTASSVELFEESNLTIADGHFSSDESSIISLYDASTLNLLHSFVSGGQSYSHAINVFDGSKLLLNNVNVNTVVANGDSIGIYDMESNLRMTGSTVSSSHDAIEIYTDAEATISDSIITCTRECIAAYASSLTVSNSKISGAHLNGIVSYDGTETPLPIRINGNEIFENEYGISGYGANIEGSGNSIHDNVIGAFNVDDSTLMDLKSNWWGDATGPQNDESNPDGLGNPVSSNINFEPWCESESSCSPDVRNPVIIVPGVLGTEMFYGSSKLWLDFLHNLTDLDDHFMNPLQFNENLTPSVDGLTIGDVIRREVIDIDIGNLKVFDYIYGLIQEFENQGYSEGIDLFPFSYDWRYGVNQDVVSQLKEKIMNVLRQTGAEKVDIIAHSTGGLLVKKYVMENPSDHDIDKSIFVGVPNTGAPQAIKNFLEGSSFSNPFLSSREMKKIAKNLPVVYDLSPSKQYFNSKGSYVQIFDAFPFRVERKDLNFDEVRDFLIGDHSLNSEALSYAENLHSEEFDNYDLREKAIDLYNIAGCKAGTLGKIIEQRNHGLFGVGTSYLHPKMVPGDGTVPLESATYLPIDQDHKYFALKTEHSEMLSDDGIRQQIVNIISGSTLETENISSDVSNCKLNGKAISVYSPLSIDITDQDGNHLGLSSDGVGTENTIPNASFEIMDEHKFVYLPDDEGQTYTINIKGTGMGTFTITDAHIDQNEIIETQVFSNIPVTPVLEGNIILADTTTLSLDTNGDGTVDQTLVPSSILDATKSQDFIIPLPEEENSRDLVSGSSGSHTSYKTQPYVDVGKQIEGKLSLSSLSINKTPGIIAFVKKTLNKKPLSVENLKRSLQEDMPATQISKNKDINDYKIILVILTGLVILWLVKVFIKL